MSKLDDLLEVSDRRACFNCSTDDVDVPKQQIKDLFILLIGPDELPHVGDMKYANEYRQKLRIKVREL